MVNPTKTYPPSLFHLDNPLPTRLGLVLAEAAPQPLMLAVQRHQRLELAAAVQPRLMRAQHPVQQPRRGGGGGRGTQDEGTQGAPRARNRVRL